MNARTEPNCQREKLYEPAKSDSSLGTFGGISEVIRAYGDLRRRTKTFALDVIHLFAELQNRTVPQVLGKQFLRSGTSLGSHYRESQRARSIAEFISKIELILQELDETIYWIELLVEAEHLTSKRASPVLREADELMRIFVASVKTAKSTRKRTGS